MSRNKQAILDRLEQVYFENLLTVAALLHEPGDNLKDSAAQAAELLYAVLDEVADALPE